MRSRLCCSRILVLRTSSFHRPASRSNTGYFCTHTHMQTDANLANTHAPARSEAAGRFPKTRTTFTSLAATTAVKC
jgi:hypothetical protein